MIINLNEIPPEGKLFVCNQRTGTLKEALSDLLGEQNFDSEFTIRPMQTKTTFEFFGFIKTELPDLCSRCGIDFRLPVSQKFKELLLPELDQPRNAKYSKPNHLSDVVDEGPSVVEYTGHHFNVGEYLHQVIGMSFSVSPAPPEDTKGDCTQCGIKVRGKDFSYQDKGFEEPISPFADLKKLKLN